MLWESFEDQFHPSWHSSIKPFIESKECDAIYEKLKKDGRRGVKIAPHSSNTFRAFRETPLTDVRVVIMGICPYHTFINDVPIADGLALSCSVTGKLQPSLVNFYRAIENELYHRSIVKNASLDYLAKQGVLLLNAALTTPKNKPFAHGELWQPFIRHLFENVIDTIGAIYILLGKETHKYERWIMPFSHIFKLSHPASASYNLSDEWNSEGVFNKTNILLKELNNYVINWENYENKTE